MTNMDFPHQELRPLPITQCVQPKATMSFQDWIVCADEFCNEEGHQTYFRNPEEFPQQKTDFDTHVAVTVTTTSSGTASNATTSTTTR